MKQTLTDLLEAAAKGDEKAFDAVYEEVYDELRRVAHSMRVRQPDSVLNTTALVNEAYLHLLPSSNLSWNNHAHFMGVAARAMRQVLTAAARQRAAEKRGGGIASITFDENVHAQAADAESILSLDEALSRLQTFDERKARIVECRFFAGLTIEETSEVIGVAPATVKREWRAAKAWLSKEMS